MSSMCFQFSLSRSMIGNFCNGKRAVPTSQHLKRPKREKTMWFFIICFSLLQFVQGVVISLRKRLTATHPFIVYHATFHSASKKKETVLINIMQPCKCYFQKLMILMFIFQIIDGITHIQHDIKM